ncbi:tRNA (adenosine(37)-N6)-threonylcarbamoyltransferase complex ATPase subunit type 1 TsaE [Acinetobacter larvae]|uniref:tRNA threonylcarbamoyladenosine biosynthesis protein TsaE n=1 Tax=Acinetobacter larvae TaxID=1789224 RepID=A0A1B2M007_9GAMM|nr:tRNA (adenosine(37)-N6)-threonylcarbamoyltransferase complex ATPase subunit type 1 TsaE [Acinetobacter larvae]AOA58499.1 tRNA (adenosine(37)-N6)-threonylcarbamoyltransferase complex ATPase subunit type 1 TsaE [Acinetobacter larvae]
MQYSFQANLSSEQDTQQIAAIIAHHIQQGVVYLVGDLGAGKTTFTRYWLHSLGHRAAVKSPTYTLVEPYQLAGINIFHFDLYRLNDPYELELMGIRDYVEADNALLLFEWPSRGGDEIPAAELNIVLEKHADHDESAQRYLRLETDNAALFTALQQWQAAR